MQENLSLGCGRRLGSLHIAAHNEAVTLVCEFFFGVFFGHPGAVTLILEICRGAVLNAFLVNPAHLYRVCISNASLLFTAPVFRLILSD